ncbi:MAG: RNA ligase family protein [Clostridia bacterium]|jgi:hypothetical protein
MSDERKLAHVETIEWIKPIDGADRIELCGILGWQCVVAKAEKFSVGDKVIYIEIDSILPPKPEYDFMEKYKYRVKTIRLRKEISQGLVVRLPDQSLPIGTDMTDALGITKYEPYQANYHSSKQKYNKITRFLMRNSFIKKIILKQEARQGFPSWVSKTDEERLQGMPRVLERFADHDVYITEKIDGQSATFTTEKVRLFPWVRQTTRFVVCSRNTRNHNRESIYWHNANQYLLNRLLVIDYPNLTIQGEQYGQTIQGNKYGRIGNNLFVFNIFDHDNKYLFDYNELSSFCSKHGLMSVPLLKQCKLRDIGTTVQDFVDFSIGKSLIADIPREGIVVRCVKDGQKVFSFKVINPEFLLHFGE